MKILKYGLSIKDWQWLTIDGLVSVLSVAVQNNNLVLYALIDEDSTEIHKIEICIIRTGNTIRNYNGKLDNKFKFYGTHIIPIKIGSLVWHVWVKKGSKL